MKSVFTTINSLLKKTFVAGFLFLGVVALPELCQAGFFDPVKVSISSRVVVSSNTETATQLLSYDGSGGDVILYVNDNSTCNENSLLIDDVASDFSTSSTTGTARIPVDQIFYFRSYGGSLYGLSSTTCTLTVDVIKKK